MGTVFMDQYSYIRKKLFFIGVSAWLFVGCSSIYFNNYENPRPKKPNWAYEPAEFVFPTETNLDTNFWYIGESNSVVSRPDGSFDQICKAWAFSKRGLVLLNTVICDSIFLDDRLTSRNSVQRAQYIGRYKFLESSVINMQFFVERARGSYHTIRRLNFSRDTLFVPVLNTFGKKVDDYRLVKSDIPVNW